MDRTEKLQIHLTSAEAEAIRERVASGSYESADAVVSDALLHLSLGEDRLPSDAILKRLVEESDRDGRLLTPDEVHQSLLDHHNRHVGERDKKIAR